MLKTSGWLASVVSIATALLVIIVGMLVGCYMLGYFGIMEKLPVSPEVAGALGCLAGFVGSSLIVGAVVMAWRVLICGGSQHKAG